MKNSTSTNDRDERIVAIISNAIQSAWNDDDGVARFPSREKQAKAVIEALFNHGYLICEHQEVSQLHLNNYEIKCVLHKIASQALDAMAAPDL